MKIKSTIKVKCITILWLAISVLQNLEAQTSWTGITSTNWRTSSNWTAGVPTSTVDAIIGDANFTGLFQPSLTNTSACKNLTIGNGSIVSVLSITRNINVSGNVLIGGNGTITANTGSRTLTVKGNWTNSGTYTSTSNSAKVTFSGTAQTLTGVTAFRDLTINSGSTLSLASNISVISDLSVSGTLDPTAAYVVSGAGSMAVNSTGIIKVHTATYAGNYSISGSVTLNRTSTVNYASAITAQDISSSFTYGILRISGGSAKSLIANLPGLSSSNSSSGKIFVDAGIFDLKTFTANRNSSGGGSITLAAGTQLKIGGTNGFPSNYLTHSIASTSTVEYYGNNQTVTATTYGNLILSGTTGVIIKTMPGTAMIIAGNFTLNIGTATSLSATAAQNITVNKDVTIGVSCTLAGASYTHNFGASWANSGTFTGSSSNVLFNGINALLSGTGNNNFNNLTFTSYGITANNNTPINVAGNLITTAPGIFTHTSGGTFTMSGTSKVITGIGFIFSNLVISGSISTAGNMHISGNFTNNGIFLASAGTITMSGSGALIDGSSTSTFYSLSVIGTLSTASSFTMLSNLSIASTASFTASAGTATMNGTSTFSGTANLFNVTINSSKTLLLGINSVLGISNVFVKTGTLDVTSVTPNTVNYNGSGAQSIIGSVYNNLELSNSGTKTPSAAVTVNNDFTINSGVIFNASTYVFSLYRHFNNLGTFTASTSDVQFRGNNAATITGATTFYNFTVNKSSSIVKVTLNDDVSAANIVMTNGNIATGTNTITTTGNRTGNGIIIGTITHSHSFSNATAYAFEGPNNLITFTSPSGITSVTVTSKVGEIVDFDPAIECVTREYEISIPAGTYFDATLRLHYENNELNAFSEPFLAIYKHNSGIVWDSLGFTARDTSVNYVELSGITTLPGRYTASGLRNIVRWNGTVSSAWNDAANWTTISGSSMANRIPTITDAAQVGVGAFTNNPTITTTHSVSVLRFGSSQSATITISGGSLSSSGSIRGQWSTSRSHILDVASGTLTSGTNLLLSDDSTGHDIHLKIGSGTVNVSNDFVHSATSAVTFTGAGSMIISGDYVHSSGTFSAGSGTVIYSGGEAQVVAPVSYYNLSFTKTTERASINFPAIVNGDFSSSTGGEIAVFDTLTVAGNITIGSSTYLYNENAVIKTGGNFQNNGNYISNNGTEWFNGAGNQSVNSNIFSNMVMDKSAGILSLINHVVINGNLTLTSGTLDLDTFRVNRFTEGGIFTMGAAATLKVKGASNFPVNYITNSMNAASTVNYYGTGLQEVSSQITYGNLTFNSGGALAKSLIGNIQVDGDLTINSGSTFDPGLHAITLNGNFTNSGTFTTGSSTLNLNGVSKTITGSTTFNDLSVITGSYVVSSGTITITGNLSVKSGGSLNFASNTVILDGDLTNEGSLVSNGTATFTGTRVQTLKLLNAISSSSTGIVNFNGTISPDISSSSSPSFATVNINNTGGITPSVSWAVFFAFNVASGATFNAGPLTHTFYGNFTNNGTISSSGKLKFTPGAPFSASGTIRLDGVSFISTGEVEFAGTAPITVLQVSPALNIVNISNTHSSGVTAPGSWSIADELRIGAGATFKAGSATSHLISGSVLNNGTLDGQTSTIRFDGSLSEINGLGTYTFNHFKIESTCDMTLNTSINVKQNFILDGVFNGEGRSVNFTGTDASTISGTAGSVTFGDFEQSKSGANTTLSVPVTVSGDLELNGGNIITTTTNILNIADDATSTSGSELSYVSGPMKKTGDDAFVFPVGKGGTWARLGISAPSLVTDQFVAQYFNTPYTNTTSMASSPTPVLTDVSVIEYWTCDRAAGTSDINMELYWENSLSGINDYSSDLVVAHWNGSEWENKGQSAISGAAQGSITSNTISSFSPFTFGSLSLGLNLLPVKLINFECKLNEKKEVDLKWQTSSEVNSNYFTIERSRDGIRFESLMNVNAAVNSSNVLNYTAKDIIPYTGVSYYRLKLIDMNGHFEYSQIREIVNIRLNALGLVVYPNPANDVMNIEFGELDEGTITIRNTLGNVMYSANVTDKNISIDLENYSRGIYIITLETATGSNQLRFTKL